MVYIYMYVYSEYMYEWTVHSERNEWETDVDAVLTQTQ